MPKYDLSEEEIKIQQILEPYFVVLDGRDNEPANDTIIEISKKVLPVIQTKIDQEVKKVLEEIKEEVLSAKYGTKNRVELLCKLNSYIK